MTCEDCGSRVIFVECKDSDGKLLAFCRTCTYEIDRRIHESFGFESRLIIVPFVERKIYNLAGMQFSEEEKELE